MTGQNARLSVECTECRKPRVIYSKNKLTERQKVITVLHISELYDYSCGFPLFEKDHSLCSQIFVKSGISCAMPVEVSYYVGPDEVGRKDICAHCGTPEASVDQELKKKFKRVLPCCLECLNSGKEVLTSMPYGKKWVDWKWAQIWTWPRNEHKKNNENVRHDESIWPPRVRMYIWILMSVLNIVDLGGLFALMYYSNKFGDKGTSYCKLYIRWILCLSSVRNAQVTRFNVFDNQFEWIFML